jgi:glycerol-3-phosphate dehydrogenase
LPHSQVKLRLTKGIHLVVERKRLPVPDAVVITEGKRVLFVIPWGERVIVGTTDTDYHGPLDDVHANREDVGYLLRTVNEFFPSVNLSPPDVISTWAGLRPLIAHRNADGSASDISRAHEIRNPEPGWWDIAGGKLTTYRLMAEQTVDQIVKTLKGLNALKSAIAPCRTAEEPLLAPADVNGVSGILPPEFTRAAVEHYCASEWAVHLDDVMVRRTSWNYYFRDAQDKAERVANWMAELLGWSDAQRDLELNRVRPLTRPFRPHPDPLPQEREAKHPALGKGARR